MIVPPMHLTSLKPDALATRPVEATTRFTHDLTHLDDSFLAGWHVSRQVENAVLHALLGTDTLTARTGGVADGLAFGFAHHEAVGGWDVVEIVDDTVLDAALRADAPAAGAGGVADTDAIVGVFFVALDDGIGGGVGN